MQYFENFGILKFDDNKKLVSANSFGEKVLTEIYLAGVNNPFDYFNNIIAKGKNIFKTNRDIYGLKLVKQDGFNFSIISLGEFITSISEFIDISSLHHEIKNPLTAIEGVVQVIDAKYKDEYLKKCTNIIKRESDRIKYLLESVNILTDLHIVYQKINIKSFIKNIVDKFKIIYSEIDFYIYVDNTVETIKCDIDKLEIVFNNLIKNACEAKNTSRIEIKYEIDPTIKYFDKEKNVFKKMVKFSIQDNGYGIKEEIRDKIFTPFWTTKSKGSGLGLIISKEIVEKHFGKIEYKSTPGVGTIFSIYLPY